MIVHYIPVLLVILLAGIGLAFPGHNTPPVFDFKRDWFIPENDPTGTRVVVIRTRDSDGDKITYGLEPGPFEGLDASKFFSINPKTGEVFLKESFEGQAGKQYFLRVTANDGHQATKIDVRVEVLKKSDGDEALVDASIINPDFPGLTRPQPFPPFLTNPGPQNPSEIWPPVQKRRSTTPSPDAAGIHIPTALPLPKLRSPTTQDPSEDLLIPGGRRTIPRIPSHIDPGHSDRIAGRHEMLTIFLPLITALLLILIVISIFFFMHHFYKKRERKNLIKSLSQKIPMGFDSSRETSISSGSAESRASKIDFFNHLKYSKKNAALCNRYDGSEFISSPFAVRENGSDQWEFPRKNLLFSRILGEGNFGQVWLCDAIDLCGDQKRETVAVKMLKQIHTDKEKKDLLSELAIMKMLGPHPNVVSLLGCCTDTEPVYLIMEHVPNGKLQTYLRNCRSQAGYNGILTAQDLTSFAYQIAKGMEYISSKGIIHRDLAARNVLLGADRTCKIVDFGFARDVMSCANQCYERKSEGPLPIRWMAPESLVDHFYTTKSDVWSFGILLWEIVTLGWTPYPGMDPQTIARQVPQGYRMEKPDHCRRELFHIMHYCWHQCPEERLSFTEIKDMLGDMLESDTDYIQLDQFPDRNYYNVVTTAFQERI